MGYIEKAVDDKREFFLNSNTITYEFRKRQLQKLKKMLKDNETDFYRVLNMDLNKSEDEVFTTELSMIYQELDFALRNLRSWMEPEKVAAPLTHKGTKNYIIKEPLGVVLIISPWNFPLQLSLIPAIGAIAAGNCVILKPSESAEATSHLMAELIQKYFDEPFFSVLEGDKEVATTLVEQPLDYIFFTGSKETGKDVMRRASNQLTPVTLELGGKSPAIVHDDANIKIAAKRIVWGKFTNAGQTCAAPDYVYVHESAKFKLLKEMKKQIKALYGKDPIKSKKYTRIINREHFNRLKAFLNEGAIMHGGRAEENGLIIEPTILDKITWEDNIMQEEIFGPILPVLTYTNLEEILEKMKRMDKPLALYFFGEDVNSQQLTVEYLSFGGGSINDSLYHLANPYLPFGGVGSSGMGNYHGKYSFDTFSHQKGMMKQSTKFDLPFRYPGSKITNKIIKRNMK